MNKSGNAYQKLQRGWMRAVVVVGLGGALIATCGAPVQAAVSSNPDGVPSFNGTVLATAYLGDTIYVGGDFTKAIVNGKQITRSRLAAIDANTGALKSWAPVADGRVKAIATDGSSVYVAGNFTSVSGIKRDSLARLDAASAAVSATFKHSILGKPYALAAGNGRLYMGGAFTQVNGQARARLAAFDLISGALDPLWKPVPDAQVEVLTTATGRIYVGGKFKKINSASGFSRLVALNPVSGSIITAFRPKATVISFGIAVAGSTVYSAHGGSGGKLNAYTTKGGLRWSATFDGDTQAVAVLGGTVYVGGHFDRACRSARTGAQGACVDGSVDRVKLAALDAGDGSLLPWQANANGIVGVLTMASSVGLNTVAAGGAFTTINGKNHKRFVQFG
ncbi:MAG TPA: PQQ-binding-like beta-propeller repeat protein [Actinoplanes sp.]|nr:PQQ-binding-like beta-propeller repeat protein [Actinoplanes sp.]